MKLKCQLWLNFIQETENKTTNSDFIQINYQIMIDIETHNASAFSAAIKIIKSIAVN